jgi:hypothetical protein
MVIVIVLCFILLLLLIIIIMLALSHSTHLTPLARFIQIWKRLKSFSMQIFIKDSINKGR